MSILPTDSNQPFPDEFCKEVKLACKLVERAYTIVYFVDRETGELRFLSGRENAIHPRALEELCARRIEHPININADGADPKNRIGKNLSGVLLVGRTALGGGRVDKGETFSQAAARELSEEFGFQEDVEKYLVPFNGEAREIAGSRMRFFALDLQTIFDEPAQDAQRFIDEFRPNSDKRALEILTFNQLVACLRRPDEGDVKYIVEQMHDLVVKLSVVTDDRERLTRQLSEFQLARSLQNHVDAVESFVQWHAYALNMESEVSD